VRSFGEIVDNCECNHDKEKEGIHKVKDGFDMWIFHSSVTMKGY